MDSQINKFHSPTIFCVVLSDLMCFWGASMCAGEKTSFEFSEWSLSMNSFRDRMSIIYRPPYSSQHLMTLNTFVGEFATYLESIILVPEPLIVIGDFNIHVNDTNDPNACEFLDLLVSMGLKQHVKASTHEGGHTLDLVTTREHDDQLT